MQPEVPEIRDLEVRLGDAIGSAYNAGRDDWSSDALTAIAEPVLLLLRSLPDAIQAKATEEAKKRFEEQLDRIEAEHEQHYPSEDPEERAEHVREAIAEARDALDHALPSTGKEETNPEIERLADEAIRFAHDKMFDPDSADPSAMNAATEAALGCLPSKGEELDEKGVNKHGVAMCECGNKPAHAWEPGESCSPERVIPSGSKGEERDEDEVTFTLTRAEAHAVREWLGSTTIEMFRELTDVDASADAKLRAALPTTPKEGS